MKIGQTWLSVKRVVSRHRGIRPQTRGSAMNPVDHPHGGGEGKTNSGTSSSNSMGYNQQKVRKTRKKKASDKLIISRRKGSKGLRWLDR
jgi:large subunit ribosomal protein L2